MSGRFIPNPKFEAEMRQEAEYRQALEQAADAVQDQAAQFADQAHAPWMKQQAETIIVVADADDVSVVNTDHAGHLMEWGSRNNEAHAPLRRAVRAAGLHFAESSKGAA